MNETTLTVDRIPPSMNDIIGQGSRWRYTQAKRDWGPLLAAAILKAGVEPSRRVYVEGRVTFPTRTKHDQGNYRFLLEKALGDALQTTGVLADDDWDSYEFGGLTCAYEKDVRRTELVLMCEPRDPMDLSPLADELRYKHLAAHGVLDALPWDRLSDPERRRWLQEAEAHIGLRDEA